MSDLPEFPDLPPVVPPVIEQYAHAALMRLDLAIAASGLVLSQLTDEEYLAVTESERESLNSDNEREADLAKWILGVYDEIRARGPERL